MDTTPQDQMATIESLRKLWNTSPGDYWPAFKASGLSAADVWPEDAKRLEAMPNPESLTEVIPRKKK